MTITPQKDYSKAVDAWITSLLASDREIGPLRALIDSNKERIQQISKGQEIGTVEWLTAIALPSEKMRFFSIELGIRINRATHLTKTLKLHADRGEPKAAIFLYNRPDLLALLESPQEKSTAHDEQL